MEINDLAKELLISKCENCIFNIMQGNKNKEIYCCMYKKYFSEDYKCKNWKSKKLLTPDVINDFKIKAQTDHFQSPEHIKIYYDIVKEL